LFALYLMLSLWSFIARREIDASFKTLTIKQEKDRIIWSRLVVNE